MSLPTLDKTWNKDLNVAVRTLGVHSGEDRRRVMFTIKDKLVNMAVPWVVVGSSDGVSSNMTGTDLWTDSTKVSFGASGDPDANSNTSWIVLQQSAINPNFQILIGPSRINGQPRGAGDARISMSPKAGFGAANGGTDGGVGAHVWPTATDEITILDWADRWLDGIGTNFPALQDFILHFWQSTDGECTRVTLYSATGTPFNCNLIAFEKPKNPIAEWTDPVIGMWNGDGSAAMTYALWNDNSARTYANNPLGGSMKLIHTCEGAVLGALPQNNPGTNLLSGEYEFFPMGLYSDTAGAAGRHGERYDLWWVPTGMLNGMTVPLTPSPTKEFWVFDNMLLVGDGTDPVLV